MRVSDLQQRPGAHERRARRSRRCRRRSARACSISTAAGRRWSTACAARPTARRRAAADRARAPRRSSARRAAGACASPTARPSTPARWCSPVGPDAAAALLDGAARRAGAQLGGGGDPGASAACLDLGAVAPAAAARRPSRSASIGRSTSRCTPPSPQLGPQGNAVIHVAKYLGAAGSDAKADERELEGADGPRPARLARAGGAAALPARHAGGQRAADRRRTAAPPAGPVRPCRAPTVSTSSATGSAPRRCSPTPAWRAPGARRR